MTDSRMPPVAGRLAEALGPRVLSGAFDRGRYATDASIYQVTPQAVVVPESLADVEVALDVARSEGVPLLPRGGGTSQCGQTVNDAVVLDLSRNINRILEIDPEARTATVEPGVVLDHLNAALKPHGLWYPVDVSTASRATIGGMTANNSCGARSIRYGMSRDNVLAIDALLADGSRARFGAVDPEALGNTPADALFRDLLALGAREAAEIEARTPKVARHVGGYNLDALLPSARGGRPNMAEILVGSEGTLAFSERITLKLSPLPGEKVMGVCHFPSFRAAMEAVQHIVALGPTAVELFDRTILELARRIPMFRPSLAKFVRGEPEALLMVEFAETDQAENLRRLAGLGALMSELGFGWGVPGKAEGGVVEAPEPALQREITEVRKQGLNIMMSMTTEAKPVSFIEDCCVDLPDLADYTDRLQEIFARHGVSGTFYAHASVGTLHVRPVLNLKEQAGVSTLRAIAEETFEVVRHYRGAHSGEHGDGIIRSEFHESMLGGRMVAAFGEVKRRFDPDGIFNPGRIVDPPRMDDRSLFRYRPGYGWPERESVFRWPAHGGAGRGLQGAVEMCNNNGACRKLGEGVMCPSYRVTRAERDLTRGRANTLRLAMSGQLGPGALTSDEMAETMKLCVSCKACRRECPTGVDMARMKIEVQAARAAARGVGLRERLVAHLPRYAPWARYLPWAMNAQRWLPGAAWAGERLLGLAASRPLPRWPFDSYHPAAGAAEAPEVLLFADTFNRYFEPENLRAAERVLAGAGRPFAPAGPARGRPLCCGRTYLAAGMVDEARAEMARTAAALRPALERGAAVVGLEPSCLLTFRDEAPALLDDWPEALGARVMLFEEYLAERLDAGDALPLGPVRARRALLHGHCHQKAFGQMAPVQRLLARIPGLTTELVPSSCCGGAGAFQYQAETAETSRAMAELSLLPRVRGADPETVILADGTSCRHQIADGAGRPAAHVATLLAAAMESA
ncbi:FAD-binding and (Fe-S)-binding domain-containing protein [Paralimibaculum aggregatum]|uniref:FAD-binding and (Fe-S)-binding domain-containing protein n=1 Tax=Paralimibaculum aggregatum TaxID=3036245 RepID=A0ABQ6LM52_9RHOB|nr:FAD-binding and (Fe-S)-binding domain-containing protein [Limibaculum sp. NKW23]GMG81734.1 FAD-binding and (Fe-S)-binding domain-containing protein [Limibaculum sp. NKW23]